MEINKTTEENKKKRLTCLLCGNHNPRHISKVNDLTKPLYDFGWGQKRLYKKKNHCNDCGFEW